MNPDRIIAAMSGGVDSSVAAAALCGQSNDVVGVTMKIWDSPVESGRQAGCCSVDDASDAQRVCEKLGIPHYTLNAQAPFKASVVDYFVREYYEGKTPNPCIPCNHALKFDYLFEQGARFGAARVATGHYAGIGKFNGRHVVTRAADHEKDQSYYLFSIPAARLINIEFPLGGYTKEQTRAEARRLGLLVAEKKESQEICFVPDDDYKSFLRSVNDQAMVGPGDILDKSGSVIGRHTGYTDYTVGQRKGLGIAAPAPLYVLSVDPINNRLVVGGKEELYSKALVATGANWYVPPEEFAGLKLTARIRSRSVDSPAQVTAGKEGGFTVEFNEPQMAISPGQAVVVYHGDSVLGGGWIERKL